MRSIFPLAVAVLVPALLAGQQPVSNKEAREFTNFRATALHTTVVRAPSAMVTSNAPLASMAGLEVLKAGGNAVDAAVAVGFALAVVYPEAGNLGGGGFLVIHMADGRNAFIDYRERAPFAATRNMFLDSLGQPTDGSRVGHRASGVPGSVAGLLMAQARFGTLTRERVMAPAIRLAREGFSVDSALAASLKSNARDISPFAGGALFVPNGVSLEKGTMLRQPALARTLQRIAEHGASGFYAGPVAQAILDEMQRGGGIISERDLREYRARESKPLEGSFRGHRILAAPLMSSGGTALLETLNILETYPRTSPPSSAMGAHEFASAFRLAFEDRNTKLADPEFVKVPVDELISKPYAVKQRARIPAGAPLPSHPGRPGREGTETTPFNVVDRAGNAVAATTTLNALYGSGVFVAEAGFFLNNEMDDLAAAPGKPNSYGLIESEANAIAGGKGILSSMTPTIVLDCRGRPELIVGARGGPRIISAVAQILANVFDHRMSLGDALAAPRWHHQWLPDSLEYEAQRISPAVLDSLRRMGYAVKEGTTGRATAIRRVGRFWEGAVDPRREGLSVGY